MNAKSLVLEINGLIQRVCAVFRWLPPLFARVVVGWVFLESGWGKLHHLDKVIEYFRELGIPAADLQAPFVATMEFSCGLLLVLGFITRLAAIPPIVIMAVALLTAKREDIHSLSDLTGISEFLYIPLLVWLIVAGAGALSLDHAAFTALRRNQLDKQNS